MKEEQESGYATGHWVNVAMLVLGAVSVLVLRHWYKAENEKIRQERTTDKPLWKL